MDQLIDMDMNSWSDVRILSGNSHKKLAMKICNLQKNP